MRKYWSQIAMLLLGITLTVGFYEGRKLVKNTAKALTAATSISGSASGSRRHGGGDEFDEASADGLGDNELAANDEDRGNRPRRTPRGDRLTPMLRASPTDVRGERMNLLRQRQRQRLTGRPGGPTGPAVPPPPAMEPDDAEVDTGKDKATPAPAP